MGLRRVLSLVTLSLVVCAGAARAEEAIEKRPFEDVARQFQSGDPATRVLIAELWGKKREAQAVGTLAKALASDDKSEVRTKAAWALGAMNASDAVAALKKAVVADAESSVRYMAAWALGRTGDTTASDALEPALADKDVAVRAQAAQSLGRLGAKSAVGALRKALRDSVKQVRTAAVVALQQLGLSDADIRRELPSTERGGALTAERKSQGVGVGLALVGAGLIYADKPVAGWTTLALELAGIGVVALATTKGAFDTDTVSAATGVSCKTTPCTGLTTQKDLNPSQKNLFIAGAVVAGIAWLTNVIWTPLAITKYNNQIDEAKRVRLPIEPFFELRADSKIFGAAFRF
jgi:hypothetical protein